MSDIDAERAIHIMSEVAELGGEIKRLRTAMQQALHARDYESSEPFEILKRALEGK